MSDIIEKLKKAAHFKEYLNLVRQQTFNYYCLGVKSSNMQFSVQHAKLSNSFRAF